MGDYNKINFVIYKITNLINSKIYIGQTNNIKKRWRDHKKTAKNPKFPISCAIQKYGINNFKIEIIEECASREELNIKEEELIKLFNSTDSNIGYNIRPGGAGSPLNVETKEKIRQAQLDLKRKMPPESKLKLSNDRMGPKNPMYGKKLSEERKQKLKEDNTGFINKFYGRSHSEETKEKIRLARGRQICSEETKQKRRDNMKNKGWKIIDGKRVYFTKVSK